MERAATHPCPAASLSADGTLGDAPRCDSSTDNSIMLARHWELDGNSAKEALGERKGTRRKKKVIGEREREREREDEKEKEIDRRKGWNEKGKGWDEKRQ